jgi:dihydroxyacetone kinase
MIPRLGKARTMGERAVGFIDPGALSVAIIFEGLAATP